MQNPQSHQFVAFKNEECPEYGDVAIPMTAGLVTPLEAPRFSWCHTVLAVIGYFCCPIFGLIALVASLTSYTDHKVKDFSRAEGKRKLAYGFGIAALLVGTAFMIGYIVVMVKLMENSTGH